MALVRDLSLYTNIDTAKLGAWGGGFGGATAMNLATGPLLGSVRAVVLTQAVLSYKSVIEVDLQPFKDNMLAAFGIPPAQEKDEALKAALGAYDPLERAKAQTVEQRALRPHILVVHGDADDHIVFEGNAVRFHEEFADKSTMLALPGIKHGVMVDEVVEPFKSFWIKHLKD